ncbi:glycosyltransferase [Gemmobacter sp.]|uniref:glycosyltransferase n=1 Tax=Gemmobacter sp. TaxID=1898957 RepID=UPI002AFE794A|nr:glycosyltransferase [Gemmobacter sp.]
MTGLLILATAPVLEHAGMLRLDVKFVEGMRAHCAHWPGPVRCILRRGADGIPFGASYQPADLGFELRILDPGQPVGPEDMAGIATIFAAADDADTLALVPLARDHGASLVYSLEYTLDTRLRIVWLDQGRSLPRKLWSMLWNLRQEYRRRRALRSADGVQANGYPALDAYAGLNRNTMMYIDGRMTPALMATPDEMAARTARLMSGAPLRLIHSGRLEPMKGAQDLLPVMAELRRIGVAATLDIYGAGRLRDSIAGGLADFDGQVRLHDPVDFESALVPASRTGADIFLSCHRQSDPSCTYIEAMGCGLAVAGYDNRMWARLAADSGAGLVAPMGNATALAARIAAWDKDRKALASACRIGLQFAADHDFPGEFKARMDHLLSLSPRG